MGRPPKDEGRKHAMAYCLFRLFLDKQPDERRFEKVRSEMLPKMRSIAGFQRFAAIRTDNGRYGGLTVYDTKDGVDRVKKLLDDWRESTGSREPAAMELRGETGLSIVVDPNYEKGYGVVRVYRTDASFDQVNAAIEQEAGEVIRNLPGMLRYTTVRFDDGRIATFNACASEQAARNMTEQARELRHKAGSRLSKVLPGEPEIVKGEIMVAAAK
jgi:hypothetical protein